MPSFAGVRILNMEYVTPAYLKFIDFHIDLNYLCCRALAINTKIYRPEFLSKCAAWHELKL